MSLIQQQIQQQLNTQKNSQGGLRIQLSAGLTEFPVELYALQDSLEILDLGGNQLSSLPEDLPRFTQLKILFASNNPFSELPEVLGKCPALEMIGFKSCQIRTVSAKALPPKLRWLILTDNQISQLPEAFAHTPNLQKLALACNRLKALPESLAQCQRLELIRISANQLPSFPEVLMHMPSLAWCAFSGNPFCQTPLTENELLLSELEAFELKELLGEGASGHIYLAEELERGTHKAVKIFKGGMTSDGYPEDEMRASLQAGQHPNLVKVEAKIVGERDGLVMELIPAHYQNLGLPPSLQSCTRDQFAEGFCLSQEKLLKLLYQATSALQHIHQQGLVHGDFYAHNVLIDPLGHLLLGDFGAASSITCLTPEQVEAMLRIEKRALAHFIEDLWQQAQVESVLNERLHFWHRALLDNQIDLAELIERVSEQID